MSEVELSANLREAMRKYSDQRAAMQGDADVRAAKEDVVTANQRLQVAQNKLQRAEEPYRNKMAEIREYIEGNALEVEESFEFAGVEVRYRSGYERVNFKADQVNEVLQELRDRGDYELSQKLEDARKISDVPPKAKVSE